MVLSRTFTERDTTMKKHTTTTAQQSHKEVICEMAQEILNEMQRCGDWISGDTQFYTACCMSRMRAELDLMMKREALDRAVNRAIRSDRKLKKEQGRREVE